MKEIAASLCLLVILTGCSTNVSGQEDILMINGRALTVEVVTTSVDQEQGLSDRDKLSPNHGMYFLFKGLSQKTFWMKNMNFPLDIVWVREGVVVGIDPNVKPEGQYPVNFYRSPGLIDGVLEINGGEAQKYKIEIGDKVKYD